MNKQRKTQRSEQCGCEGFDANGKAICTAKPQPPATDDRVKKAAEKAAEKCIELIDDKYHTTGVGAYDFEQIIEAALRDVKGSHAVGQEWTVIEAESKGEDHQGRSFPLYHIWTGSNTLPLYESDKEAVQEVFDAHNAALAAEREKKENAIKMWRKNETKIGEVVELLLQAQAAIAELVRTGIVPHKIEDIPVDCSALDKHDAEVRRGHGQQIWDQRTKELEHDKAVALKPLVDALEQIRDMSWHQVGKAAIYIAADALAKVGK